MNSPAPMKASVPVTAKIPVTSITINQAEGLIDQLVKETVTTYAAANALLRRICQRAPNDGTYDKTDFVVIFADGQKYEGRFDAQNPTYPSAEPADLALHMRNHVEYLAGYSCPTHITEAQYSHQLAEREKAVPGSLKDAGDWLRKYSLTDPITTAAVAVSPIPAPAPAVPNDSIVDRLTTTQMQLAVILATIEATIPVYQKASNLIDMAKARFRSMEVRKALAAIIRAKDAT